MCSTRGRECIDDYLSVSCVAKILQCWDALHAVCENRNCVRTSVFHSRLITTATVSSSSREKSLRMTTTHCNSAAYWVKCHLLLAEIFYRVPYIQKPTAITLCPPASRSRIYTVSHCDGTYIYVTSRAKRTTATNYSGLAPKFEYNHTTYSTLMFIHEIPKHLTNA